MGCRSGSSAQGRDDAPVTKAMRAAGGDLPDPHAATSDPHAATSDPHAATPDPHAATPGPPGADDPPGAPAPQPSPAAAPPPGPVEADQAALVAALTDPDASARLRAAEALARLGTPTAADALAPHALPGDPLEAVAVAGLGWAGGHSHADRLLAALRSPDAEARAAAAQAVGAAATSHWDRALAYALQVDRPEVRAAALQAIGLASRTTMLPDVARWSRDPDPVVRAAALQALRRLPMPGAALLLAERTEQEQDPELRAIATAGEPSAPPRPAACPAIPTDPAALEALLVDPAASLVTRALCAVELGRQAHTAPLARVDRGWPRLIRAAALLARVQAGDLLPPEDAELERRALLIARMAHPALRDPLDACLPILVQGDPPP